MERGCDNSGFVWFNDISPGYDKLIRLWSKVFKSFLTIANMYRCIRVKIPYFWLSLIYTCASYEGLVYWIGLGIGVIIFVIGCWSNSYGLDFLPSNAFRFLGWFFWLSLIECNRGTTIFGIVTFLSIVEIFLVWLWFCGLFWLLFLGHQGKVTCYGFNYSLGKICYFGRYDYLLDFFQVFITGILGGERLSSHNHYGQEQLLA